MTKNVILRITMQIGKGKTQETNMEQIQDSYK